MSALISKYKPTMYLTDTKSKSQGLKSGDIVELGSKDFDKFLEHGSMKNLLKQFEKDKPDRPPYWVVLNKACDMVHGGSQQFDKNLFLCPLQGLRDQLRKGPLKRLRHIETSKSPYLRLEKILKTKLKGILRSDNPQDEGESAKDYGIRLEDMTVSSLTPITNYIKGIEGEDNPDDFETASLSALEKSGGASLLSFFEESFRSGPWGKYKKDYHRIQTQSQNIILLANSSDSLSKLCRNQLEAEGIFFFEPHRTLFKKNYDLSYVIEFEDMLTIKIKNSYQASGKLVELLKESRILSLKPKFSSRLQNMMGNYFSKVGTDDIFSQNVMDLYGNYFKQDMYFNINDYNKKHGIS